MKGCVESICHWDPNMAVTPSRILNAEKEDIMSTYLPLQKQSCWMEKIFTGMAAGWCNHLVPVTGFTHNRHDVIAVPDLTGALPATLRLCQNNFR